MYFGMLVASYYGDFEQKKCVPYIVIPNPPAIIWGDPDALTRIFSNVVYNALVHGEGNYQITAAIEEAQTVITIKNASSSIQQEDIPHLFDRFYTTRPVTNKKDNRAGIGNRSKTCDPHGRANCRFLAKRYSLQFKSCFPLSIPKGLLQAGSFFHP